MPNDHSPEVWRAIEKRKRLALGEERENRLRDHIDTYYEADRIPARVELPCGCVSLRCKDGDSCGTWEYRKWIETCTNHEEAL